MEISRRSFLDTLLFTSLAATAFATLAPVPFYFLPPADARPRRRQIVARPDPGAARKFLLGDFPAILINDGGLRAFDARCTHQQCPVNWNAASKRLTCPCHGAVFDANGAPVSGPARSPLAGLHITESTDGEIVVEG